MHTSIKSLKALIHEDNEPGYEELLKNRILKGQIMELDRFCLLGAQLNSLERYKWLRVEQSFV